MGETSGEFARADGERIAWRRTRGRGPTVLWLGGFRSDMGATKAQALADWAGANGRDVLRFDYFAHGASSGDALKGSITRWREDVLTVIDGMTQGPLVLAGSSMGGWLALLAALARPGRVKSMVLIAPATDFTEALLKPSLPPQARAAIARGEAWMPAPDYPITPLLLEDGARWTLLPGPLGFAGPVRILQGAGDQSVPWTHAQQLVAAIDSDDVVFTLIKDGDHRLSRPQDIARLLRAVEEVA
jgi:pimeloyl-ACP methyl ester carboxylesterase